MSDAENSPLVGELPADDLIEIHDPEIDPAQIMAQIRARIQQRRLDLGYLPQNFISFGGAQYPGKPDDVLYDADFYEHLQMANELYLQVETEIDLQSSPATRVPILGRLWGFIRYQAHGLSIYYVNRAAIHQLNVDREIISVLNRLAIMNQEQQRALQKLKDEIEVLRAGLKK